MVYWAEFCNYHEKSEAALLRWMGFLCAQLSGIYIKLRINIV